MLLCTGANDKIVVTLGSAVTCESHASFADYNGTVVTPGRRNLEFATAASFDVVLAPGAGIHRNVKLLIINNIHATSSTTVTVEHTDGTTVVQIEKVTLLAGEALSYSDGGWFIHYDADGLPKVAPVRLDAKKYVTGDYVNATTSFTDITGLAQAVEAGKHYCFECHLFHRSDATTSGSQFGINGPAMTLMSLNAIQQITASVTAAAYGSSAAVTALETAAVVETTGPGANTFLAILSGYVNPSAAGTFAVRGKSEVAVAAGLTVKKGSWLRIWEADA